MFILEQTNDPTSVYMRDRGEGRTITLSYTRPRSLTKLLQKPSHDL